jgi:shikimate kinase
MNAERHIRNLALIGFMGSGKSTVGHLIARTLGFEFVDTDHLIEARAGMSITEVFARRGETAFRELEKTVVDELADREHAVISTGGGVGANPELLASLKRHALVVWLWVSPDIIWQRVRHQTHRPLLQVADPEARIRELLVQRTPVYRQADVLVNAGARRTPEVVDQVVHHFRAATRGAAPA